uniref:Protein aurora borealis n=1 Tax=Setaria digitata TaxID=48799 RepID=A0A915Q2H5_9BILA
MARATIDDVTTKPLTTTMNVTSDSDIDVLYSKPKFNSTVLGPDERLSILEGSESAEQHALKLSPIPKDRMQFMDSSSSSFAVQHFHNTEESLRLQDSNTKVKKIKIEEKTSSSFIGSSSKSAEGDKGNMGSKILHDTSIHPKSNITARSHITNPFDSDIMGSLSTTTYSPSLFDNSKKSKELSTPEKSFRWSIGQMADFHPVKIDETESVCQTPDPVQEAQIHNAIEKFWASQKYVLPSPQFVKGPSNSDQTGSPSIVMARRTLLQESPLTLPTIDQSAESQRSIEVQTMFTFPPNLDLIGLLGNYFQYEEGEVAIFEANLSLNTLRRKLFIDAMSSQTNTEIESDDNCDECAAFSDGRPPWYHSTEEMMPARRVSLHGLTDSNDEAGIRSRLISPDISPIKS